MDASALWAPRVSTPEKAGAGHNKPRQPSPLQLQGLAEPTSLAWVLKQAAEPITKAESGNDARAYEANAVGAFCVHRRGQNTRRYRHRGAWLVPVSGKRLSPSSALVSFRFSAVCDAGLQCLFFEGEPIALFMLNHLTGVYVWIEAERGMARELRLKEAWLMSVDVLPVALRGVRDPLRQTEGWRWIWTEIPEKGRRQVSVDARAGVAHILHGSRCRLIHHGTSAAPGPDGVDHLQLLVWPLVRPPGTSAAMLAALQLRWSEPGICPMDRAKGAKVVILSFSVDMASSNVKILACLVRVLPKNCLVLPLHCTLRQIQRILVGFEQQVPDGSATYSLSKLTVTGDEFEKLPRNIAAVVWKDCCDGRIRRGLEPPAAHLLRRRSISKVIFNVGIDAGVLTRSRLPRNTFGSKRGLSATRP